MLCVCVCVWGGGAHGRTGGMCAAGLLLLSPICRGPPDGSGSKVTELWLDNHRSPASISHPVHFGNTWLFLGALGPGKEKEECGGKKGRKGEREEGRMGGTRRTTTETE